MRRTIKTIEFSSLADSLDKETWDTWTLEQKQVILSISTKLVQGTTKNTFRILLRETIKESCT